MPIEVVTKLLEESEDLDLASKFATKLANNTAITLSNDFKNSKVIELDPNDGRKIIIKITADLEKTVIIEKEFIFPPKV